MPPITIRAAAARPGSRNTSQAPAPKSTQRPTATGTVPIRANSTEWTVRTIRAVSRPAAAAAEAAILVFVVSGINPLGQRGEPRSPGVGPDFGHGQPGAEAELA